MAQKQSNRKKHYNNLVVYIPKTFESTGIIKADIKVSLFYNGIN
jgi:hypothetical protein